MYRSSTMRNAFLSARVTKQASRKLVDACVIRLKSQKVGMVNMLPPNKNTEAK